MGSEYILPPEVGRKIMATVKDFLATYKPGTEVEPDIVVSGHSQCNEYLGGCQLVLRHTVSGGEAVIEAEPDKLSISASDFPYPSEFKVAKRLGIPLRETSDWCIDGADHQTYCSARRW